MGWMLFFESQAKGLIFSLQKYFTNVERMELPNATTMNLITIDADNVDMHKKHDLKGCIINSFIGR